ncbi:Retrotransposon nucleocapsid protein [Phytophthora megakarya]|uniref:Retrotransposon nucleocapsid protein n=1 Tax=Phytophthora megakarya TaxID=4795 RepID=A0A225W0J9_9STRA|nr:Retrotransposon nucleocapsid protein [Phytophthora megakarya]
MLCAVTGVFVETSKRPGCTDLLKFKIDTGISSLNLSVFRKWKVTTICVLMIRKPNGGVRFWIGYRKLNAVTIKDSYPMPLIDDILDVVGKVKIGSTIASGFPTHLIRVGQVLERFQAAGFKLKMKKWGRNQVVFLGHIVTPSGIPPHPKKVNTVLNVARPHDLRTVRAFWVLTSYLRRYIPGFGAIAAPLERLKEKGTAFRWSEDCKVAFNQLQRSLVRPPILVNPDFSKRFKLYVYSSHQAVGACLMQEVDGRNR